MSASWRPFVRRLWLGGLTLSGLTRRGWFIPYRWAEHVPEPGSLAPYLALQSLFAAAESRFRQGLATIEGFETELLAIGERASPPQPRWGQDWFCGLDAAFAYASVRAHLPRRIFEVGSGHSTRFLARALQDAGAAADGVELIAIDPDPRADIRALPKVRPVQKRVQDCTETLFANLQGDDILFIDSSHILMPGTDVDYLFNRILPQLPPGLRLHIHDIFLPYDYPTAWGWRGYNEQQGVALLLQTGAYRIDFASTYIERRMAEDLRDHVVTRLPRPPGAHQSSLWLRKA